MRLKPIIVLASVVCALAACQSSTPPAATAPPAEQAFDVLITNGRVVDGTGAPWFRADVGIKGDRIQAVGPESLRCDTSAGIFASRAIVVSSSSASRIRVFS